MGSKIMPTETMQCKCKVCSKEFHIPEAKYCTRCGTKLKLNIVTRTEFHPHH